MNYPDLCAHCGHVLRYGDSLHAWQTDKRDPNTWQYAHAECGERVNRRMNPSCC
jgi:hypothetical protein